jgi:hypothetical protein
MERIQCLVKVYTPLEQSSHFAALKCILKRDDILFISYWFPQPTPHFQGKKNSRKCSKILRNIKWWCIGCEYLHTPELILGGSKNLKYRIFCSTLFTLYNVHCIIYWWSLISHIEISNIELPLPRSVCVPRENLRTNTHLLFGITWNQTQPSNMPWKAETSSIP